MCQVMLHLCFRSDSLGNSHWETFVQCQGPCSQKQTCRESSRPGQREKFNCEAVETVTLADPTRASGAGMAF